MAVNLATKYEKQFAAAFKPTSFFEGRVNTSYTFDGAEAIKVYSPVTTELVNYQRTGANRYGNPTEMDTAIQTMTLAQDKGFTKTLDRGNYTESMMAISAANWMTEQIKGVVGPNVEKHAVAKWVANGVRETASGTLSKTNITENLMKLFEYQVDHYVPEDGKYLYISGKTATLVKTSPEFVGIDSLGEKAIGKGQIGMFNGAPVIVLPSSYMPAGCHALLARKDAILMPKKIKTYKTHINPPGVDGWLMEGRVRYDAFVLSAKKDGVTALVDATYSSEGFVDEEPEA